MTHVFLEPVIGEGLEGGGVDQGDAVAGDPGFAVFHREGGEGFGSDINVRLGMGFQHAQGRIEPVLVDAALVRVHGPEELRRFIDSDREVPG